MSVDVQEFHCRGSLPCERDGLCFLRVYLQFPVVCVCSKEVDVSLDIFYRLFGAPAGGVYCHVICVQCNACCASLRYVVDINIVQCGA